MATINQNNVKKRLTVKDLTEHELDVLLSYRTKKETNYGIDILLDISSRTGKNVPTSLITLGFTVNQLERCCDQFTKMQKRVSKMNREIGEYVKDNVERLEGLVTDLREKYNEAYVKNDTK